MRNDLLNKFARSKNVQVFALTLMYYASLYFSIHNRSLLILTILYCLGLYLITKKLVLSLFLTFIVTLPFAKGKGYQIILLPKEQITRWTIYKISYFFPLYLADIFLGLLAYTYLRQRLQGKVLPVAQPYRWPLVFLTLFITWVAVTGISTAFPDVSFLSTVQLVRMLIVFSVPLLVERTIVKYWPSFYSVVTASLTFQSLWVFLQRLRGGPLGLDIEATLPGAEFGILSSENVELLRSSGTFFEPSILGTFLLMHILILAVALMENHVGEPILKKAVWSAITLGSLALVFTGSRSLYFVLVVVAIFLWRKYKPQFANLFAVGKKYITRTRVILMLAIICVVFLPYVWSRVQSLGDVFSQYGSGSYRVQMAAYALRLSFLRPLTGVGINHSPYHFATGFVGERFIFDPTYPHNLLFQLLAETGAIGLILFVLFVYTALRPSFGTQKNGTVNKFSLAAAIYLISAQVYPIFINHQEIASFFFLYAGLSLATLKGRKNAQ